MKNNPIVLQHENTAQQAHDVLAVLQKIAIGAIHPADVVSRKAGNALKIGSDGKLYIHQCCLQEP